MANRIGCRMLLGVALCSLQSISALDYDNLSRARDDYYEAGRKTDLREKERLLLECLTLAPDYFPAHLAWNDLVELKEGPAAARRDLEKLDLSSAGVRVREAIRRRLDHLERLLQSDQASVSSISLSAKGPLVTFKIVTPAQAVAVSDDGMLAAVISLNGPIALFHTPNPGSRITIQRRPYTFETDGLEMPPIVKFSPSGERLAVSSAKRLEMLTLKPLSSALEDLRVPSGVSAMEYLGDAALIMGTENGYAIFMDLAAKESWRAIGFLPKVFTEDEGHQGELDAAFRLQNRFLTGGADGSLRFWDADSGAIVNVVRDHFGPVTSIAVDASASLLATGSEDHTIRLRAPVTGTALRDLIGHNGAPAALVFRSSSLLISSSETDRTTRFWDTASGRQLLVVRHPPNTVSTALSANGRFLVSAQDDLTVKIWELKEPK